MQKVIKSCEFVMFFLSLSKCHLFGKYNYGKGADKKIQGGGRGGLPSILRPSAAKSWPGQGTIKRGSNAGRHM